MYWHIDTDIISLLLLIILFFYIRKPFRKGVPRMRYFLLCVFAAMLATAAEIISSMAMELPVSRVVYHTSMTIYFALLLSPVVTWFLYTASIIFDDDARIMRRILYAVCAAYAAYVIFSVSNLWTGLIYTLGEGNAYQRGPLFFMLIALYALCTLAVILLVAGNWKKVISGFLRGILMILPLAMGVGIYAQLSVSGWLMILPTYTVSIFAAFLYLQNQINQDVVAQLSAAAATDAMTGLLNRMAAEHGVNAALERSAGKQCMMLLIDMDDLKSINDTLGHPQGDCAIRAVAQTLREHFRSTDIVARVGGDEFVVFLPDVPGAEPLRGSIEGLVDKLAALHIGKKDEFTLNCSVGAAVGIGGRDSFASLYTQADQALYHVKQTGKRGYAFYT